MSNENGTAKPSLLWHSNAPHCPTGYGQQTSLFVKRLKDDYRLGISAFYGLEGNIGSTPEGIPVFPAMAQTLGNETIIDHAEMFFPEGDLRGGLTVTLMDVWPLSAPVWRQLNLACWVPIDHDPCPPLVSEFLRESGAVPIAMSQFGETMLTDAGLDPLYVPHGIDTGVFKPLDKQECRRELGLPEDVFVVGMFAANKGNPSRKCFAEAFEAFKLFHDAHPDSRLYVHTEASGVIDGVNMPDLIRAVGLDSDVVVFPNQYRIMHYPYSPENMAIRYGAIDVLLAASAGEGFGIPTVEAQACGRPVIVSDWAASPELCGAGWIVEGRKRYTPMKAYQFQPYVEDIVAALSGAFRKSKREMDLTSEKARAFALDYDVDTVLNEHLLPALRDANARFADKEPVEIKAGA